MRVQPLDCRISDRLSFFNGLTRNEPRAVQEFIDMFGSPPSDFAMDE